MNRKTLDKAGLSEIFRMLPGMLLLIYGLGVLGYLTVISWSVPILDLFAFRQTQTALSIYWMQKGGPLIAYQTPVAGYPWSIPFEFPIYQWLVALLAGLSRLSIDQAGRIIGIAFFLGAATILYRIVAKLTSGRALPLACAGAFVACPMAIFWARSVMIESTVLFFSLAFIYGITQYHATGKRRSIFASAFFAICAALVKITTFYCFAIILAMALLTLLVRKLSTPRWRQTLRTTLAAGFAVAVSLTLLVAWVKYSDNLKQQEVIGSLLTSAAISAFNFGTLAQRLDIHSWSSIIFGRAIYQILGSIWILFAAVCILASNARFRWAGVLLLLGYLAPFLTFTNLHYVHSYYQFANFAFLTTLVGLAIGSLTSKGTVGTVAASLAAVAVALMSWHVLQVYFVPTITADQSRSRTIELARFIREHSKEDQALLIFGMDWSSELPYYATRKAIAVPDWASDESLKHLLDTQRSFGSEGVGALIVCPSSFATSEASTRSVYDAVIKKYSYGRSVQVVSGCQVDF